VGQVFEDAANNIKTGVVNAVGKAVKPAVDGVSEAVTSTMELATFVRNTVVYEVSVRTVFVAIVVALFGILAMVTVFGTAVDLMTAPIRVLTQVLSLLGRTFKPKRKG
jgi:hypothetical protein